MSARSNRERPPSGRVFLSELSPKPSLHQIPSGYNSARSSNFQKSNNQTESEFAKPPLSNRSEKSLSNDEIFNRLKGTSHSTIDSRNLGGYNSFSRPKSSSAVPLRTVFLDPEVNNFPRSKTRTELIRRIKASGAPHPSYDLDKDGYVSQQDYKLAKRFDFDGNGIIDAAELSVGKQIMADEFFTRNAQETHNFGVNISNADRQKNVSSLANSEGFERAMDRLTSIERTINSTKPLLGCLRPNLNKEILKHNFFTNKFDTTAWNDSDAIPRAASTFGLTDHGGSRKRLIFSRNETFRNEIQCKMETMTFRTNTPVVNTRRVNMITDIKVENGKDGRLR